MLDRNLCVCLCVFCRVLDKFDILPGHLTEDLHLFSLNDLNAVRNGDLVPRMKELLKLGTMHVAGCVVRSEKFSFEGLLLSYLPSLSQQNSSSFGFYCSNKTIVRSLYNKWCRPHSCLNRVSLNILQLCQAKGFVCEFCGNEKDIIFPFQLHKCQRCEGEHAPLGAGLGGPRSPFPCPSLPHIWRDWKPRRLSNVLLRDMREGEGGEEASDDIKSRGLYQISTDGSKGDVEEQEEAGGGELEVGGETHEKGRGGYRRKASRNLGAMLGDRRVRREANLLKTLHIDRLKKSFSKGDSDSESMESPEETAQERKHFWNVPKLKVFPKRNRKDEGIEEEKEDKEGRELAEDVKVLDKSAETERSSEERFSVLKLFRAQKMSAVLSRGRTEEEEEDRSRENDGKTERGAKEGEATIVTRKTWRGRKTRRARRITRGRKIRDPMERENKAEGGESTGRDAGGSESSGGDEGGQSSTVFQTEEG